MEIASLIPQIFINLKALLCELLLFYCRMVFLQLPFLLERCCVVCECMLQDQLLILSASLFYATKILINQDIKGCHFHSTVSVFPLSDFKSMVAKLPNDLSLMWWYDINHYER